MEQIYWVIYASEEGTYAAGPYTMEVAAKEATNARDAIKIVKEVGRRAWIMSEGEAARTSEKSDFERCACCTHSKILHVYQKHCRFTDEVGIACQCREFIVA